MKTCIKCGYTRKPEDEAPEWQCPSCEVAYAKAKKAIELDKKKAGLLAEQQLEEAREAKKAKLQAEREAERKSNAFSQDANSANKAHTPTEQIILTKPVNKPLSIGGLIAIVAVVAFVYWFTVDSSGSVNPFSVGALVILFMGLGAIAAYLLPSLIAIGRKHNAGIAIFFLNLFLGWTVLFWIVALVWSLSPNVNQEHILIVKK